MLKLTDKKLLILIFLVRFYFLSTNPFLINSITWQAIHRGRKELDMTELAPTHTHTLHKTPSVIIEGAWTIKTQLVAAFKVNCWMAIKQAPSKEIKHIEDMHDFIDISL